MGRYINPHPVNFQTAINSEIYIDKTELIIYTNKMVNTQQKYMCISRPRRFGKTMAMNMLAAYYEYGFDNTELFKDCIIRKRYSDSYIMSANKYNVVVLTMTDFFQSDKTVKEGLEKLEKKLIRDFNKSFPDIDFSDCDDIIDIFSEVFSVTNHQFVVLIDEWDSIFRESKDDYAGHKQYLDFLRNLLKDKNYIALVYMTGILPIKKYGKHSALNMFDEYSMDNPSILAPYFGFTAIEVKMLCEKYAIDFYKCQEWYDGYLLKYNVWDKHSKQHKKYKCELYSPLSLVKSVKSGEFSNYWNKTETYEALKEYILLNINGLKNLILRLISGDRVKTDTSSFVNDMTTFNCADDVLTLLIHLGYLGYDSDSAEVFIPNNEIRSEFALSIKDSNEWSSVYDAIKKSDELLEATLRKDGNMVADIIENLHFETSILQYNDENALSYVISLAYYTARRKYKIVREMPLGKGYADLVFLPLPHYSELPAIVVELKWNHSAETAINQIKDNKYCDSLKGYFGKVLLVGINYKKNSNGKNAKKHQCTIKEWFV